MKMNLFDWLAARMRWGRPDRRIKTPAKGPKRWTSRRADGYYPLLGVLQLAPLADWLILDATTLSRGTVPIDLLRAFRCRDLENHLCPLFNSVVEAHFELTLRESQTYLDNTLRSSGIIVVADDSPE